MWLLGWFLSSVSDRMGCLSSEFWCQDVCRGVRPNAKLSFTAGATTARLVFALEIIL
jgi:hypothetical protein